jgi:signal transduction histidine kinase
MIKRNFVNLSIAWICLVFVFFNYIPNCLANKEDSLLQALEYQKDTVRINTLNELCWYYIDKDLSKSKIMAESALQESKQINYLNGIIFSHRKLSSLYRREHNFDSAQYHLHEALKIIENLDSPVQLMRINTGLGNLYTDIDNHEKAFNYYKLANQMAHDLKDSNYYSITCNNIGINLEIQNKPQEAISYYHRGLSYSNLFEFPENYTNLLINMGAAQFYSGNKDSAFYYNNLARQSYINLDNKSGVADCYLNEGYYYEVSNQFQQAIGAYQEGFQYFKNSKDLTQQYNFTKNIMLTYGAFGNVDSMYHYFYLSEDYGQKLQQAKTDKAIHEIAIKYDVEKKEQSLKLAQQENEKIELSNSLQQKTIYILLSVIVIIGLIVFIFYKLNREKQKLTELEVASKNQEIEVLIKDQEIKTYSAQIEGIEKERKRVAQDLHDKIGGILATIKLQFESNESLNEKSLAHVKNLVNESIKSVRSISHNLSDGRIDEMGLIQSIKNLKESLIDSGKMHFDLFLENYNDSCNPEKEREIFKIILELLSNTLKHAQADHIVLQINVIDQIIHITFEDNGIGFDPKQIKKGLGMRTISQRVDTLHGNWYIDSKENHGSTIVIEIPLS